MTGKKKHYATLDVEHLPVVVSVSQAARLSGLSRAHVRSLAASGVIPAFKNDPNNDDSNWKISSNGLLEWIDRRLAERGV